MIRPESFKELLKFSRKSLSNSIILKVACKENVGLFIAKSVTNALLNAA